MGLGKNVALDVRNVWGNWYVSNTDPVGITGSNVKPGDPWCQTDDDLAPTAVTGLFVRDLANATWISMLSSGPEGEQGDPGNDGAPGSVWHHGAGVPSDGTGINGDYYFDDTTGQIYYKSAGTWGLIATVQGEDGTSFIWRGVWDVGTDYAVNDVVSGSDSNLYIALVDTTGDDPISSPTEWDPFLIVPAPTISDGDYGDIVISGAGTVYTIDSAVISTYGRTLTVAANAGAARTVLGLGTVATLDSDTDGTLAANSDSKIATQKATKTYVDTSLAAVTVDYLQVVYTSQVFGD